MFCKVSVCWLGRRFGRRWFYSPNLLLALYLVVVHRTHEDLILGVILLALLKGVRLSNGEKGAPILALGEG